MPPDDWGPIYNAAGRQYGIDPRLLRSIVQVESGGNPNAVSPAGAKGPAQLMPETAKNLGVADPTDPHQAITGAAKLLRENLDRYGKPSLAVAAYHGGTDQSNWGPKTRAYVDKVNDAFSGLVGVSSAAAAEPAPAASAPSVFNGIAAAKAAGHGDADIADYLQKSPRFGPMFENARKDGHDDADIFQYLGLKLGRALETSSSSTQGVIQADDTQNKDGFADGGVVAGRNNTAVQDALTGAKDKRSLPEIAQDYWKSNYPGQPLPKQVVDFMREWSKEPGLSNNIPSTQLPTPEPEIEQKSKGGSVELKSHNPEGVAAARAIIAADPDEGKRASPAKIDTGRHMAIARRHVDGAASNEQIAANNARLGHAIVSGLNLSIETPKGRTRFDRKNKPPKWEVPNFPADYGRIKGTKAADGEGVDIFIGPNAKSTRAFVIDQIDPATGKYDEAKTFLGFDSPAHAASAYDLAFPDGSGPTRRPAMAELSVANLKKWLRQGNPGRPINPAQSKSMAARWGARSVSPDEIGASPPTEK